MTPLFTSKQYCPCFILWNKYVAGYDEKRKKIKNESIGPWCLSLTSGHQHTTVKLVNASTIHIRFDTEASFATLNMVKRMWKMKNKHNLKRFLNWMQKACLNDTEDGLVNWPFPCLDSFSDVNQTLSFIYSVHKHATWVIISNS